MIQFRVYLRAELGKLRNRGDAEDCVQKIGRSLIKFGLRDNAPDLAELLHSQEAVDSFVAELTDEHAQHLTEVCSKCWRNNDVFDKLQLSTSWQEDDIPVERIKLQQSEPT